MKKIVLLMGFIVLLPLKVNAETIGPTVLEIISRDKAEKTERIFVLHDHDNNLYRFIKCSSNLSSSCHPFGNEVLIINKLSSVIKIIQDANAKDVPYLSYIYGITVNLFESVMIGTVLYGIIGCIKSLPNIKGGGDFEFDANLFFPAVKRLWWENIYNNYNNNDFFDIDNLETQTALATFSVGLLGWFLPQTFFYLSVSNDENDYTDPLSFYRYSVPNWEFLLESINDI